MEALLSLFSNPAFLPGVLMAGVPVLIHLLSRQRAKEVYFPSLRFLRLTAERTASRRRLEELILLLLRAVAVALIALALSRPILSGGAGLFGESGVAAVILVDNSLSMNQEASGRSAFARAKEAAADVLASLPAGSRWAVWHPCAQAEGSVERHLQVRPAAEKRGYLSASVATAAAGSLTREVQRAIKQLRQEKEGMRELYVLSDGQASAWERLESAVRELGPGPKVRVFVYTAAGAGKPNVTLDAMRVSARAPLPGEALRLETVLRGHGPRPTSTTATLYVNGVLAGRQKVNVPAGGGATALFTVPLVKPGWVQGLVQVDADACPRDNRAFFALQVRDAIRVLLVEGNASRLAQDRASHYLAAALAPRGSAAIRPRRIAAGALVREDLHAVDAVFLLEVPGLSAEAIARLKTYVRGGGTLVMMPGRNVKPGAWNRLFGAETDTLGGLLPAALGAPTVFDKDEGRSLGLQPGDAGDPLLASFAAIARSALRRVKVHQAFALTTAERSPTRVAAQLPGGAPFIASKVYGTGRVILWAAPCTPAWTTIQARPVFVPLVHAHAYLGLGVESTGGTTAGTPVVLAAPTLATDVQASVQPPKGKVETITGTAVSREQPLLYANTWQEGIYEVRQERPAKRELRLAVSPAGSEGDLAPIADTFLTSRLARVGPTVCVDSIAALAKAREEARRGVELLHPLLIAAMLLLLAEALYGAGRAKHAGL